MKNLNDIITAALGFWLLVICYLVGDLAKRIEKLEDTVCIKLEQPEFLDKTLNDSILFEALKYYDIEEPEIVLAQAKLESANYKSKLCREKNNLFGLYDSRSQQYFSFDHWTNSIIAYKNMIEYKRKDGEDYYKFLERIGYAEDSKYVNKLKSIVND